MVFVGQLMGVAFATTTDLLGSGRVDVRRVYGSGACPVRRAVRSPRARPGSRLRLREGALRIAGTDNVDIAFSASCTIGILPTADSTIELALSIRKKLGAKPKIEITMNTAVRYLPS